VRGPSEGQSRLEMSSFPDFYRYWSPRLTRYLKSQTSDGRWVEDIAQDALLAARSHWEELLTYDRPDLWLFKVATRMLRRWQAKAREQCTSLDDMIDHHAGPPSVPDTDEWVNERIELIQAIRALPRRQAEVLALHYLIGHSLAEVAQILGVREGTAKTHLYRARHRLREMMRSPRSTGENLRGRT
jgi:RNA polymerase sigma factor (sigma-70 family)